MLSGKVLIIDLSENAEHQKLLDGQPQTRGMRAGKVSLPPGRDCGEHNTANHEELLVFLAGEGEIIVEKNTLLQVGAGKVSYIPPGTTHNVRNTANVPLIYIYCVAPTSRGRTNEQS